jgi:hypothetical protein
MLNAWTGNRSTRGGKDPECERGEVDFSQEALDLFSHDFGSTDVRVESLLPEDDVVVVLAVVQHLPSLHALGDAGRHVVGDAEEADDLAEDHGGVRLGLERAPDHRGHVRLALARVLVPAQYVVLSRFCTGGQKIRPGN